MRQLQGACNYSMCDSDHCRWTIIFTAVPVLWTSVSKP